MDFLSHYLAFIRPWMTPLLLFLGTIVYWYVTAPRDYWKKKGVPFVPVKPLIGSLDLFSEKRTRVHEIDYERYKKYGRIFGFHEAKRPVLVVADPNLLRNILVKDFQYFTGRREFATGDPLFDNVVSIVRGETWKRIRTIITPAFSTGKIKRMTDIILTSTKALVKNFAEKEGKPVDSKILFGTYTMDVIASVAFGTKINSYHDPNNRFVVEASKIFSRTISWRFVIFLLFPWIIRFFRIGMFKEDVAQFFKQVTLEIIEERKKTGKVGKDFLQLLIDAQKEEQASKKEAEGEKNTDDKAAEELGHDENNADVFKTTSKNKHMSQNELIAQCIIFFLAGYDTTSTTLALTCHMLAKHPKVQEKLREEVDETIRQHDNKVTYDAVQDMKYLDKVISEALRMFPLGFRVERLTEEDYKLGDTGITIEKGTLVMAPVFAMHYDPDFYPDPHEFRPERFTAEEKSKRHPYSYLAFGAGPRNCIGMRFALMEMKLCLAYMISQLKIIPCPETMEPLDITSARGVLQPKNVMISVEIRENRVFDGL